MGGGYSSYKSFLLNKTKRLLIPYVFVANIWVIPISVLTMKIGIKDILWKYVLATNPSQLWFLWMLFGVFAIVWPIWNLMSRKPLTGWAVSLGIFAIGVVGNYFLPNVFCIWTACQFVPFFFSGSRIRVKEEQSNSLLIEKVPVVGWILMDIVLLVAFLFVVEMGGLLGSILYIGIGFILHIVGAIMAWRVLQWLGSKVNRRETIVFKLFTSYSMPMYLFHQQLIYFTIIALNGKVSPWINAGANFVVAIIGSLLISIVLMHWKTTRMLIGEK